MSFRPLPHRLVLCVAGIRHLRRALITSGEIDTLPKFSFQEERSETVEGRIRIPLIGILLPTALLALAALFGIRRFFAAY